MSDIEATLAVANQFNRNGDVLPPEVLKTLADGKTLFWDEARQALIYRGPVPPPAYTCPRCGAVSYNANDIAQRYCGRCHKFATNQ